MLCYLGSRNWLGGPPVDIVGSQLRKFPMYLMHVVRPWDGVLRFPQMCVGDLD
jgi:hypothetical protein